MGGNCSRYEKDGVAGRGGLVLKKAVVCLKWKARWSLGKKSPYKHKQKTPPPCCEWHKNVSILAVEGPFVISEEESVRSICCYLS